jgi:hypothetical protein
MMFGATALSVETFFPTRDPATLPITMQHIGVILRVFPVALLMQPRGRWFGSMIGSVFGMVGASTRELGLYIGNLRTMRPGPPDPVHGSGGIENAVEAVCGPGGALASELDGICHRCRRGSGPCSSPASFGSIDDRP